MITAFTQVVLLCAKLLFFLKKILIPKTDCKSQYKNEG